MRPNVQTLAIPAALLLFALYAVGSDAHGPAHNPTRHSAMMKRGIPVEYKGVVNPLAMTSSNLLSGKALYDQNCATCHGLKGNGDGVAAGDLKPAPARLAGMYKKRLMQGMGQSGPGAHIMHGMVHHHPGMTHSEAMGGLNLDAYNFWAISEGGEPIDSAMPAFKELLTAKQRWQIVLYLANGFSRGKN